MKYKFLWGIKLRSVVLPEHIWEKVMLFGRIPTPFFRVTPRTPTKRWRTQNRLISRHLKRK